MIYIRVKVKVARSKEIIAYEKHVLFLGITSS